MDDKTRMWFRLLQNREGRILFFGICVSVLYILWLAVGSLIAPEMFQALVGMTATHILFGRAAGMSFGYTMLMADSAIISTAMLVETILVMLFYPLFVFSWEHLIEVKVLRKFIARASKVAEENRDKIRRYGVIGLLGFVWFPFWMTGPLVGSVIGYFLGFKALKNLFIVLSGTYLAILGWAFFLNALHERVAIFSPYAPVILLIAVIIIGIIGQFLAGKNNGEKQKK